MPSPREQMEDLTRDLDMVVFRLEGMERRAATGEDTPQWQREGRAVRRELERLRDRMEDVARGL